jgi:hypothetical protein
LIIFFIPSFESRGYMPTSGGVDGGGRMISNPKNRHDNRKGGGGFCFPTVLVTAQH